MSISVGSRTPPDLEGEADGHDYRLSDDQFRRTIAAGIIPEADHVVLRDGFLVQNETPYRLSLAQYRAMADSQILTTDDRVELLEGWLVAKMTKHPRHEIAKGLTQDRLTALVPAGWFVAVEGPTDTTDSEPEPDLMIVKGSRRDYLAGAPTPKQVALVVEVADSGLTEDRIRKKRLYARASFSIYWLINLINLRIEVYTAPTGPIEEPDYRCRQDFGPGDTIPVVIDGQEIAQIAVRDLLP